MPIFSFRKIKIFICLTVIFSFASQALLPSLARAQEASKEEESLFVAKKAIDDGFYDVAIELLERFLKTYPDSAKLPEANLLIGECYFHQNRFLDALGIFEKLLDQPQAKSIRDAVLYWTAEVHFKGNNFEKAANYYRRVVEEFPSSAYLGPANYSLGWALFQDQKFQEAMKYFQIVQEKYPQDSQDAAFKVLECLYNLKDYAGLKNKAGVYLKAYAKDIARLSFIYFYLAEADYYLNNFNDAIVSYNKALENTRDEKVQALSKLGKAWSYLKVKQYKEAEEGFADIAEQGLDSKNLDVLLLGKAIVLVQTDRVNEAKAIYEKLLSATRDPLVLIQAYIGKAEAAYNLSQYEEAIKIYKEALSKVPEGQIPPELADKLHYNLAWSYLKQGEFKDAIVEFQKIVRTSEDKIFKVSALCQIGDTYQDSGEYIKAQEAYDAILKDYPDSFYSDYVQYQLGLVMLKSSNYDGAILAFQALKKNYPGTKLLDDAEYALGLAYFQKQDYNSSKDVFERFQKEHSESSLKSQALYLYGTSLFNLEKYQQAIEVFKDIIRQYNQNTELVQKAEYEIADCFYQMGNESEAMERFKALRSKYPESSLTAEIMWWLGEYYYRHNDLDLARRYFSSLVQDFPKSNLIPDAYYALGSCFQEESKFDEALENFKKVLELTRADLAAQAAIAIADIYVKQDKPELAVKAYQDLLKAYPHLAHLIYPKAADLYSKLGKYQEAMDYYRKSLQLVPVREMPVIQLKIAETEEAQGYMDKAIEEYSKVPYLYPENESLAVKALLRIASIYEERENFKEAEKIYQKIIGMNVEESKFAQERIERIKSANR